MFGQLMEILIHILNFSSKKVLIEENQSIADLKEIFSEFKEKDENFQFIFQGKILENSTIILKLPNIINSFLILYYNEQTEKNEKINIGNKNEISRPPLQINFQDPPNIEDLLKNLIEMGFSRDLSLLSLRINKYNLENSVNLLICGNINLYLNKRN